MHGQQNKKITKYLVYSGGGGGGGDDFFFKLWGKKNKKNIFGLI